MAVEVTASRPGSAIAAAWSIVRTAGALADELERAGHPAAFRADECGTLAPTHFDSNDRILSWSPRVGWCSHLPGDDPRRELLDLYLPICGASYARPVTVGHLGQSLDGFIATHEGDSRFVTGDHNIAHLHRMRALCDAVVVGAGTVACDDPQLTVRLVPGSNPLRVVFDPGRRLAPTYRVFTDDAGPTIYICARTRVAPGETHVGHASIVIVDDDTPGRAVADALRMLRARGCSRVFVEGGGVTVSAFLQANLLERLHIAIAPVIIGDGRPAIRLAPQPRLSDCRRPSYRVFRMGGDVMFDCELHTEASPTIGEDPESPFVKRII
jgi:riboflavin-specific deaminase-like protein